MMICGNAFLGDKDSTASRKLSFSQNPNVEILLRFTPSQPNKKMLKNDTSLSCRVEKSS